MSVKITFIGAGSLGFTRTLIHDLLSVEVFRDAHFALHDIDSRNLSMVEKLILRDVGANNLPAVVTATRNRIEAVADADYVINTARVGGCEAFRNTARRRKSGSTSCVVSGTTRRNQTAIFRNTSPGTESAPGKSPNGLIFGHGSMGRPAAISASPRRGGTGLRRNIRGCLPNRHGSSTNIPAPVNTHPGCSRRW